MANEIPEDEDFDVEDVTKPKRKKGVNSGGKGRRGEKGMCKLLTERFGDAFSRTIGSGNRISQVTLPQYAQDVFAGDVVCPENFKWVFEIKNGYNGIDLCTAFVKGHTEIDKFLAQAEHAGEKTSRKPILCWKKDHKKWLAFLHNKEVQLTPCRFFKYYMVYGKWLVVSLDELLKFEDNFWRD